MRLINANLFKENILSGLYVFCQENKEDIVRAIDCEPTVNIPNYGGQVVPDTLQGWRYEERPQGEWIIVKDEKYGDNVKCPFCGKELAGTDLNFCVKCGASMKGGAE